MHQKEVRDLFRLARERVVGSEWEEIVFPKYQDERAKARAKQLDDLGDSYKGEKLLMFERILRDALFT